MKTLAQLACALLVAASIPAWADVGRDDAAAAAQRIAAGRVLSVDKSQSGSRAVWRVKIVTTKGDVMVILIDAASGRVL